jgi:hypothetical protein
LVGALSGIRPVPFCDWSVRFVARARFNLAGWLSYLARCRFNLAPAALYLRGAPCTIARGWRPFSAGRVPSALARASRVALAVGGRRVVALVVVGVGRARSRVASVVGRAAVAHVPCRLVCARSVTVGRRSFCAGALARRPSFGVRAIVKRARPVGVARLHS